MRADIFAILAALVLAAAAAALGIYLGAAWWGALLLGWFVFAAVFNTITGSTAYKESMEAATKDAAKRENDAG